MNLAGGFSARDLARVRSVLELHAKATGKDVELSLNRFMRNVSIFASAKTKKADVAKIERDLRRMIGTRIAGASGRRLKKPKPIITPTSLARAIIVKRMREAGEQLTNAEIVKRTEALVKARVRSAGFHKAGYIPALREFGAPASRSGAKAFGPPKGTASKATETKLRASLRNFATGVDLQGDALAAAVREALVDMETYAKERLAKRAAETNKKLK